MGITMKQFKFLIFLFILSFSISCGQQKKYIEYKVKQGETIRSIAKNLEMKPRDLLRLNPNIGRKPATNTVIIIPNKKLNRLNSANNQFGDANQSLDSIIETSPLDSLKLNFVIHEVKPKETIYGLTRFYNVSKETLFELNPSLSEGLKYGQLIKIKKISNEDTTSITPFYEDTILEDTEIKIALLLPFKSESYDTIPAKDIFIGNPNSLVNIVTDYYLGAQIAIDSLRSQGLTIDVSVFDTGDRNSMNFNKEIDNLNEHDIVFGPLYSDEIATVAQELTVPLVFPFYSKSQVGFTAENIIKVAPEKEIFREELTDYVKENFTNGTLIVVGDGKARSKKNSLIIKQVLEEADSIKQVHILEPKDGYIAKELFLEILEPLVNNWVVMAANDNIIIEDAVNSIMSLPDSLSTKLFAFDKNKAFDKIDNFKLAKLGFTYVSDQFVEQHSTSTQLFDQQYQAKNNTLPSFYATKGFDITYDIVTRLASGKELSTTFSEGASYRIESKFDYHLNKGKATENKGVFIVKYNPDLTLDRVK